jgi:hypothetical protein
VAHFEVVVLSEIKIEQVALQNGIGAGVEDRDEFAGNKVGKKEYNDTRESWIHCDRNHVRLDQVESNHCGRNRNKELRQEHECVAQTFYKSKLGSVLQYEEETVKGRRAERLTRNSHVNVGVSVQVSNKSVKTIEAAGDAA